MRVHEKSAGAVTFRKEGNKVHYLLLHYEAGHWGFPKGHIEKGESLEEAALRELEEETSVSDVSPVSGFKGHLRYFFKRAGRGVFKTVTYFLVETKQKEVKLSLEHDRFEWLPFGQALEQLTFQDTKQVLKKANEFLGKLKT